MLQQLGLSMIPNPELLPSEYFLQGLSSEAHFREVLQGAGVNQVAITIITGRCGSSLLAEISTLCGFGTGAEIFFELPRSTFAEIAPPDNPSDYVSRLIRYEQRNGILSFQITPQRLRPLDQILPLEFLRSFGAVPSIIFRRNIFAQAISYFNAIATGLWHSTDQFVARNYDVALADSQAVTAILLWVLQICAGEIEAMQLARDLGTDFPAPFYYEDITSATYETALAFFDLNRFPVDSARLADAVGAARHSKIDRARYKDQYQALRSAFPALDGFVRQRISLGYDFKLMKEIEEAVYFSYQRLAGAESAYPKVQTPGH